MKKNRDPYVVILEILEFCQTARQISHIGQKVNQAHNMVKDKVELLISKGFMYRKKLDAEHDKEGVSTSQTVTKFGITEKGLELLPRLRYITNALN